MHYYFLRFAGTKTYLGETLGGERVAEEQPVDPTQELPRPFASVEAAEATARYYKRKNPGVEFDIVTQELEWVEPEGTSEAQAEPEPEPQPEPSGFTLRRVSLDGGETVVAEGVDAAKVRFRMGNYTQVEGVAPFALFGDKGDVLTPGQITGTVTAEALDANGKVIATATL